MKIDSFLISPTVNRQIIQKMLKSQGRSEEAVTGKSYAQYKGKQDDRCAAWIVLSALVSVTLSKL